jgi:hypothetical protein
VHCMEHGMWPIRVDYHASDFRDGKFKHHMVYSNIVDSFESLLEVCFSAHNVLTETQGHVLVVKIDIIN